MTPALRGREIDPPPPACWWQTAFNISGLGSYWSTALVVSVSIEVVAAWAYSTLQLSSHLRSWCLCSVLVESWLQLYRLASLCFRKMSFFQQQAGLCAYQVIQVYCSGWLGIWPQPRGALDLGPLLLQDDMLNFPYRAVGNIKHTISYELYT